MDFLKDPIQKKVRCRINTEEFVDVFVGGYEDRSLRLMDTEDKSFGIYLDDMAIEAIQDRIQ